MVRRVRARDDGDVNRSELGAFLRARRAAVAPDAVGLPGTGSRRRVPGLRREEVADLVGLSTDYYVRLEQGRSGRPSDSVLEAIGAALRLDTPQRRHLQHLAHPPRRRAPLPREPLDAATRALVDTMTVPTLVMTDATHVLGWNALASEVFTDFANRPLSQRSTAWLLFSDADAAARHRDWAAAARDTVGMMRMALGRTPDDPDLTALVADLSARSPRFRRYWSEHHVYEKSTGLTRMRHPVVGDIDLAFLAWRLQPAPHHLLVTYTPEPGSASAHALDRLRSSIAARA